MVATPSQDSCHDCDKGYDKDTFQAHPCDGKWCAACKTKDCKGYLAAKETARRPRPTAPCHLCKRSFYGDDCLANYYLSTNKPSLCLTLKKCTLCCKEYEAGKKAAKHKCGWGACPYCTLDVKIDSHQCYIQPQSPTCDDPCVKTVPLNRVGARAIVNINACQGTAQVERDPPLLVYADYKAVTGEGGLQTPIMVCAESEEEEETHTFYGSGCTKDFFDYLDELCVDCDGDD